MPVVNVESFEPVQLAHAAACRNVAPKDWNSLNRARELRVSEITDFLGRQLPIPYLTITD